MGEYVLTGRLVQGDPYKMQQKKDNNGKPVFNADGTPFLNFFVALAVSKGDPKWPTVRAGIDADAARLWPGGETRRADFAYKIGDGDSTAVNKANRRNCDYDGFPGNHIVKVGTLYPPVVKFWDATATSKRGTLGDWVTSMGGHVKIGDYVSIAFDVTSNKSTQTPGIHLNPKMIGLESSGEAIVGAGDVDATEVFGARGAGGNGAPAATTGTPAATNQTSGTAAAGSYTGYMDTDAPPPPADDAPPPPSGPQMTAKATGKTYESFTSKGWTDAQLREHGYIV